MQYPPIDMLYDDSGPYGAQYGITPGPLPVWAHPMPQAHGHRQLGAPPGFHVQAAPIAEASPPRQQRRPQGRRHGEQFNSSADASEPQFRDQEHLVDYFERRYRALLSDPAVVAVVDYRRANPGVHGAASGSQICMKGREFRLRLSDGGRALLEFVSLKRESRCECRLDKLNDVWLLKRDFSEEWHEAIQQAIQQTTGDVRWSSYLEQCIRILMNVEARQRHVYLVPDVPPPLFDEPEFPIPSDAPEPRFSPGASRGAMGPSGGNFTPEQRPVAEDGSPVLNQFQALHIDDEDEGDEADEDYENLEQLDDDDSDEDEEIVFGVAQSRDESTGTWQTRYLRVFAQFAIAEQLSVPIDRALKKKAWVECDTYLEQSYSRLRSVETDVSQWLCELLSEEEAPSGSRPLHYHDRITFNALQENYNIVRDYVEERKGRVREKAESRLKQVLQQLHPQWKSRDEVREAMGDRWYNNPNPKHTHYRKREKLEKERRELMKLLEHIDEYVLSKR